MDPYTYASLTALASGAIIFLVFRFLVPLLPGDGRQAERWAQMERERQEREAASKAAE